MQMMKMKFKNFEFPSNPSVINIKYSSNINEKPLFGSDSSVEAISKNASIISGEGSFVGAGALQNAQDLEQLANSNSCGWLFLPSGNCFKAFLKELAFTSNAKKNEVFYKFCFIENCNHKENELKLKFVTARENENLFDIAYRCKCPLEKIMELNEFKTPFDIKSGDKVVLK